MHGAYFNVLKKEKKKKQQTTLCRGYLYAELVTHLIKVLKNIYSS